MPRGRKIAPLLAANPNDVEGLTLRGEMLLDAGKSAEAVADFRRAYNLDKGADWPGRTRELLRNALLAGLRDDFAAHRGMAEEVESLLDSPGQRATYYRYMAGGLHRAGQWPEALEYYLKLVDLEAAKQPLERIERSYLVRRDCWVRARLGELRRQGGAAVAAADRSRLGATPGKGQERRGVGRPETLPRLLRRPAAGRAGPRGIAPSPGEGRADPGGRDAHGRGGRFHRPQGPGRFAGGHGRPQFPRRPRQRCRRLRPTTPARVCRRALPCGQDARPVACRPCRRRRPSPGGRTAAARLAGGRSRGKQARHQRDRVQSRRSLRRAFRRPRRAVLCRFHGKF